jgi:hypothetical protein
MATRLFECSECDAYGKITLKGNDHDARAIVCCPVCGADISEVDDDYEEEE